MRNTLGFILAVGSLACAAERSTDNDVGLRLAPPTLSLSATARPISNASGGNDLEVSALLRNSTKTHIGVAVGAQCPLFVRIFPDPTGEQSGALDASMGCPSGAPQLDVAPSDSLVLTRILSTDELRSFPPGAYGINVAVTTTAGLMGGWAGAVQLPLGTAR